MLERSQRSALVSLWSIYTVLILLRKRHFKKSKHIFVHLIFSSNLCVYELMSINWCVVWYMISLLFKYKPFLIKLHYAVILKWNNLNGNPFECLIQLSLLSAISMANQYLLLLRLQSNIIPNSLWDFYYHS